MCLGSGGSRPPVRQQEQQAPVKTDAPIPSSQQQTGQTQQKTIEFGDPNKTNPKAYEDTYMGKMTNIHRQAKFKDPGINL